MYFTSLGCQGNISHLFFSSNINIFLLFQLYFNDQKPVLIILVVVDDDNTGVDAVFRLCGTDARLSLRGGYQSRLSAGIVFNVASAGQSRLRAKITSVGPTSNPHSLVYIPKKLNETSRQRLYHFTIKSIPPQTCSNVGKVHR